MRNILVLSLAMLMLLAFAFTPATSAPPKSLHKFLDQAAGQMKKQQYDQAIATLNQAIEQGPESATVYNLLGMAYRFKYNQVRNQELKQQEIAAFKKAIEIDPDYWVALINLGTTYYYQGEKAKAAPLLQKALELHPKHPEKAQLEKMIQEGMKKP